MNDRWLTEWALSRSRSRSRWETRGTGSLCATKQLLLTSNRATQIRPLKLSIILFSKSSSLIYRFLTYRIDRISFQLTRFRTKHKIIHQLNVARDLSLALACCWTRIENLGWRIEKGRHNRENRKLSWAYRYANELIPKAPDFPRGELEFLSRGANLKLQLLLPELASSRLRRNSENSSSVWGLKLVLGSVFMCCLFNRVLDCFHRRTNARPMSATVVPTWNWAHRQKLRLQIEPPTGK